MRCETQVLSREGTGERGREVLTLRTLSTDLPAWLEFLIWFLVFTGVAFGCRWLVMRMTSDERRRELAEHAHKLIGALAATFAFLVGFAITITWSSVSEGQQAVENQAAYAQQLAWSLKAMGDDGMASALEADLRGYLMTAATQDSDMLAQGAGGTLPSSAPLDALAADVHAYSFAMDSQGPEGMMLVSNVQSLAMGEASIIALSQRQLPILLAVLLVISGVAMAAVAGIDAATVSRPYLLLVWCFVSGLAISVAFILDHPFGGALAVDFRPIIVVAESLGG